MRGNGPRNDFADRVRRDLERAERTRARAIRAGVVIGGIAVVIVIASVLFGVTQGRASDASEQVVSAPASQGVPATVATYTTEAASASSDERTPESAPKATDPAEPKTKSGDADAREPRAAASRPKPKPEPSKPASPDPQRFRIAIGNVGYEPSVVRAKSNAPIVLTVAQGEGCAAGFLIPKLDVSADNSSSDAKVELGKVPSGTYKFTCGMGMVEGKLIVE